MWLWLTSVNVLMHHSIPAAPCPLSPDNYEASARLVPGAGHLPTLGASPKNLSTPLKVRFLTFNMYFNLKSLISKQIVRACIDCHGTQQPAFDSFYRCFSRYYNFSGVLVVKCFLFRISLQQLSISLKTHCEL